MHPKERSMRKKPPIIVICLFALCVSFPWCNGFAENSPLDGLQDYTLHSMDLWEVPGLAMAVVQDGRVIFEGGFGVRDIHGNAPVTPETVFAIGSSSKAFTVAALGMLADEGKLDWNAPVINYMPRFRLSDPWVTRNISLSDMLSHRTGLKGADILWIWKEGYLKREDLVSRMRFEPQAMPFRAQWHYNNLMYLASGQVIPAIEKVSWDVFIRQRIFQPLGMHTSFTSISSLEGLQNVAMPHVMKGNRPERILYRNIDSIAPAGAINSNIRDMSRWLQLQLGSGAVDGKTLIQAKTVRAMRAPMISMPIPYPFAPFPGAHFLGYGMGWFLHDYHGVKVVEHGGNIDGMTAQVALIPEKNIGLVILTNMNTTRIREVLMYTIFDRLMGRPVKDWNPHFKDLEKENQEGVKEAIEAKTRSRKPGTSPALPLQRYTGTYHSDLYGDIIIGEKQAQLTFTFQDRTVPLTHWHYDSFQRPFYSIEAPGIELVTFRLSAGGTVDGLNDEVMGEFRKFVPSGDHPKKN